MSPETPIRLEFERPPLIEQAITVAFEPIQGFTIADYGLFWQAGAQEFTSVTTETPLPVPVENFEAQPASAINFQVSQTLPLPRAMFRTPKGELLQLQNDRFSFNWVKEGEAEYPRSEIVMARFEELLARFEAYLARNGRALSLRQCEVTNLNVIPVSDFGNDFGDLPKALNVDPLDLGLPFLVAETYIRNRQYRILGQDGKPIGRLHTGISPVFSNQDGSKGFKLELTARSAPIIRDMDHARWFFSVARNAINGAFSAIIMPDMRQKWGETHV